MQGKQPPWYTLQNYLFLVTQLSFGEIAVFLTSGVAGGWLPSPFLTIEAFVKILKSLKKV